MWICLNDAFLSIVNKDSERGSLLVRARRKGDIERIFGTICPDLKVSRDVNADYLYRASIPTEKIIEAMEGEVRRIVYPNFKASVKEDDLHNAYMRVWTAMSGIQNPAPYSGGSRFHFGPVTDGKKKRKKKGGD